MTVRASKLFLPTLREDPADAEAASHKLLVRGGYIRQLAAGVWTLLPLGFRVHQNVLGIIREEMNAIGSQEMLGPVLTPAELWEKTGRSVFPEVFRLRDRNDRQFLLPMTHEEQFTWHARELSSYKQLPQIWYHFSTKERDEPRPRAGLIRVREFVMKDAYSFDRDEEGLEVAYRKHSAAYHRIFERCGLEVFEVAAEPGMMGGKESDDFLAPAETGENTLVTCENCDYAADSEIAHGIPRAPAFPERLDAPEEVETPGIETIEALAEFLGIDPAATSKAMPVVQADGTLVLALVRGDDRLDEAKLASVVGAAVRPATVDDILASFGADPGSLGPVGVELEVIADEAVRDGQFVAGANRTGFHLRGVEAGRDFQARFADLREAREGDRCPRCGGRLSFQTAIEVGHIFKFGDRYSKPLGATFLDETGHERPLIGGSYGIGLGRTIAAIVEQHRGEQAIRWPASVAPYQAEVVALPGLEEQAVEAADELSERFGASEVLLDDRAEARAGEKFADADLIGAPVRVIVGRKTLEDGAVDVRLNGGERRVSITQLRESV